MDTTQRISELEAQATAVRGEIERVETAMYHRDEWTAAEERRVEVLTAKAWALEDEAEVMKANAALADREFATHALASLTSLEPGPTFPGNPMVWHAGRELWCDEVLEAWTAWHRGAVA